MSKTDAIRAMKQARSEAQRAAAPAAPVPTRRAAAPAAAPAAIPASARPATSPDATGPEQGSLDLVPEALCGHTAISGRRCTRPQGHPEKNHRYAA